MYEGSPHPARFARDPPPPGEGEPLRERALISDSIVKQPACEHAYSIRRDSSSPLFGRRGGRRPLPPLIHMRERSAERRFNSSGTLRRRRALCDQRAHLPALHRGVSRPRDRAYRARTERDQPSRIPDGFRRPRSGPSQPFKAAPRSRDGRRPEATRDPVCVTGARAPHLAPSTKTPLADALN